MMSTGTITALNGAVLISTDGESSVGINITGTWVGTISIQATTDGVNFFNTFGYSLSAQSVLFSVSANTALVVNCSGFLYIQVIATAFTSGTANIAWNNSNAGNFSESVQPISGVVTVSNFPATVAVTQSTSPWVVSGTVTSNIGTTGGLALNSDLQAIILTPGVANIGQKAPAMLGAVTTAAPTYTNATLNYLSLTTAGALRVDGSGVTQPISAVSLPLPTGASTSANQATEIASLASIDAGIPTALGQTTMAASMPVTIASDQSPINTRQVSPIVATYSAATSVASAALATDIFIINGSATKTIKVLEISVTGTQTTTGIINLILIKRSTANTGGTTNTLAAAQHDSNDAAPTAIVKSYSANPTAVGTSAGIAREIKMFVPAPTGGTSSLSSDLPFDFGNRPGEPIVLRGVAQGLAINLNATTVIGGNFDISIEWTEE